MSHRIRLGFLFWGMTLVWFFLYCLISPEFGGIDITIFKEAGANWALGKGFVASLLPGNRDPNPLLYASYLPLYPLLFGVYSKIFGVGAYQNTFFNLALAWSCALLWYQLIKLFFRDWQGSLSSYLFVGIISLLIPTAMLGVSRDRPENLSLILFLGSILLSTQEITRRSWVGIFLLCGMNGITSPFCALIHLLSLFIIHRRRIFRLDQVQWLSHAILFSGLPLVVVMLVYLWIDPSAFQRFLEHGTQNGSGLAAIRTILSENGVSGYFKVLISTFSSTSPHSLGINLSFLASLLLFPLYYLLKFGQKKNHEFLSNWIFFLGVGLLPVLLFPTQGNYFAFTRDVLLAGVLFYGIREERVTTTLIRLVTVIFVFIFFAQAPLLARDVAIRANNRASFERATNEADRVASLLNRKSPGMGDKIGVWPGQYFIFKGKVDLVDLYWIPSSHKAIPRYLAFGYAESGDLFKPVIPANFSLPAMPVIISEPKLPQPTEVLGRKISKSSNTWESLIFENPDYVGR